MSINDCTAPCKKAPPNGPSQMVGGPSPGPHGAARRTATTTWTPSIAWRAPSLTTGWNCSRAETSGLGCSSRALSLEPARFLCPSQAWVSEARHRIEPVRTRPSCSNSNSVEYGSAVDGQAKGASPSSSPSRIATSFGVDALKRAESGKRCCAAAFRLETLAVNVTKRLTTWEGVGGMRAPSSGDVLSPLSMQMLAAGVQSLPASPIHRSQFDRRTATRASRPANVHLAKERRLPPGQESKPSASSST